MKKSDKNLILWIISVSIILMSVPFICLFIDYLPDKKVSGTFLGLTFSEFTTDWLSMWGILVAMFGVWQVQKRISQQSEQLKILHNQLASQILFESLQNTSKETQLRLQELSSAITKLESTEESVRSGGINALYEHARKYPDDRQVVCDVLCSHIRSKASVSLVNSLTMIRGEVKIILRILFKSGTDVFGDCEKNLTNIYLAGQNFMQCKISNADFSGTQFNGCVFNDNTKINKCTFINIKISDSEFLYSEIKDVQFYKSELSNTLFNETNLYKIRFSQTVIRECNIKRSYIDDVDFRSVIMNNTLFVKSKTFRNLTFIDSELKNVSLSFYIGNKDRIRDELRDLEDSHIISCEENAISICKN